MLRKMFIAMMLAVVGLFAASGVVSAAPAAVVVATTPVVTSYPPNGAVTLSGNNVSFAGRAMRLFGTGFRAFEGILLTLPDGSTLSVTADAAGNFAVDVTFALPGSYTVRATGLASGRTASFTVNVLAAGTTTSLGTTTVGVTTGTGATGTGATGTGATGTGTTGTGSTTGGAEGTTADTDTAVAGAGSGSGSGAGLASTGANIAWPLTLGISALLVGVALLFFGTRLATRRKQGPPAH